MDLSGVLMFRESAIIVLIILCVADNRQHLQENVE